MNARIYSIAIAAVISLLACVTNRSEEPSRKVQRPQIGIDDFHSDCPPNGAFYQGAFVDFFGTNNLYVTQPIGNVPQDGQTGRMCYFHANLAERRICTVYAYLNDALSLDPLTAEKFTADEKIQMLKASLLHLRQASEDVTRSFWIPFCPGTIAYRRSPEYRKYISTQLAEVIDLTRFVVEEGAPLLQGLADGVSSDVGSYEGQVRSVWGEFDSTGVALVEGRRGTALSLYYGAPWKHVLDEHANESVFAALSSGATNEADPAVAKAINFFTTYGLPVMDIAYFNTGLHYKAWSWPSDPTFGERCIVASVNRERAQADLPPISTEEVLISNDVSRASLALAAQALLDRTRVELFNINRLEVDGCIYLSGFNNSTLNIQPLVARATTGLFTQVGADLSATNYPNAVSGINGLEPMFSRLSDIRNCLVNSQCEVWRLNGFASEILISNNVGVPIQQDAKDQVDSAFDTLRPSFGERYIEYTQIVPQGGVVGATTPRVAISAVGFTAAEYAQLKLYRVEMKESEHAGVNSGYYDVLSCLTYGKNSRTSDCLFALAQWETSCYFTSDMSCLQSLPWGPIMNEVQLATFIVATEDGRIVDMYHERRPRDAAEESRLITRHYTSSQLLATKAERITRRSLDNRVLPYYNALDLPNDLPVPVENELTSDSDSYEDSFSFYVSRAKEAAESAKAKVQQSIDEDRAAQTAEQRVENAAQDALDRIEQICGAGNTSCSATKGKYTLSDLRLLPDTGVEACDEFDIPTPSDIRRPSRGVGWFVDRLEDYARCSGQALIDGISMMPLDDLPIEIKTASENGELTNYSFSNYGGEYKIKLLEIKNNLTDLRSAVASIQETYLALSYEVKSKKKELKAMQLQNAANLLKGIADLLNPANMLAGAGAGAAGVGTAVVSGMLSRAAIVCSALAGRLKVLSKMYGFIAEIIHKIGAIEQATLTIEKAVTGLQQNIEALKLLELEQEQSASRADRLADEIMTQYVGDADQKIKAFRKLTLMSAIRARRSLRRAKKMSFIARRALEMKLAVNLSQEKEASVIGDPASTWINDIYKIGYVQSVFDPDQHAGAAVVEYVQKLEDYVYNYPFQYPFADGSDSAVLSMRDDLSQFNESCREVDTGSTRNLLAYPEAFDRWFVSPPDGGSDWLAPPAFTSTVSVSADEVAGYRQTDDQTGDSASFSCITNDCISLMSGDVALAQPTSAYTGSVYVQRTSGIVEVSVIAIYSCDEAPAVVTETLRANNTCDLDPSENPRQAWLRCTVTLSGVRAPDDPFGLCADGEHVTLSMEIKPSVNIFTGPKPLPGNTIRRQFQLWGAQLEEGSSATGYQSGPVYMLASSCIDAGIVDPVSGEPIYYMDPTIKSERLRDSFAVKCADDDFALPTRTVAQCAIRGGVDYYERSFSLTMEGIENGEIVRQGQIGAGNYNYRIRSLALNLVGSNIKDCSLDPGDSTSCYANQFIPFDLLQDGRVKIRNHSGVALPFKLSNGQIHQGKAIAAERLLTNPLSSTDSSLVQQHLKDEFRGRPIQGVYTVRIHATPSLRWDNIEDVQVLMNYRYWSAFSAQ